MILHAHAPEKLAFWPQPRLKRAMTLQAPQKNLPPSPDKPDTTELLQRVGQDRDRTAFVTLFNYFAPRVKSYLLKNGAGDSQAEEIVQNTFVTVWEKAHTFNPEKSAASTWIFTIARNKRIDTLRREKFVEVNSDDSALENAIAEQAEDYADHATIKKLSSAIDTLPPEQADLIRLAFFQDKSHSAIAEETRLPLGTVKSRLRLALEKLKHLMTKGQRP